MSRSTFLPPPSPSTLYQPIDHSFLTSIARNFSRGLQMCLPFKLLRPGCSPCVKICSLPSPFLPLSESRFDRGRLRADWIKSMTRIVMTRIDSRVDSFNGDRECGKIVTRTILWGFCERVDWLRIFKIELIKTRYLDRYLILWIFLFSFLKLLLDR